MRRVLSAAVFFVVLGCGSDDEIVGPDGSQCTRGSIALGQSRSGSLASQACQGFDAEYSQTDFFYESFTVRLEKGTSYFFTIQSSQFDPVAELIGDGGERIAFDDDIFDFEAHDTDSELYFVAGRSGVFSLRVRGYDDTELGSYVLAVRDCSGLALTNDTEIQESLVSSDCLMREWFGGGDTGEASFVDMFVVPFTTGQTKRVRMVTTGFTPAFEVGGPGFDFFDDAGVLIPEEGIREVEVDITAQRTGDYLLITGSRETTATGTYTLRVTDLTGSTQRAPLTRLERPGSIADMRDRKVR